MEQQKIECAINFDISFGNEISKNVEKEEAEKSIECYADNVKFTCVWQKPEVNVHIINQIINQINVFDDNEYGDCTPSNITALISASFPSSESLNELNDDAVDVDDNDNNNIRKPNGDMSDITAAFVASTPISTIKTSRDVIALNDDSNDKQMLLLAFNNMSPILITASLNRQKKFYRQKRRLHLS